jgi:Response regulators consisting of a CheY-like receiver domain and a winged-helix DNA-binding domain
MARIGPCISIPAVVETRARSSAARSLRILVVDDNVDSAESLSMLLALDGHDTRCAFDGRSAVALATGPFAPEVVLLDIGLPALNGYEVARHLREHGDSDLTLVAMTGWDQSSDHAQSRQAGFDAHLVKPVDYDGLKSLLEELVRSVHERK